MLRPMFEISINGREFCLVVGDITKVSADAIGNAANSQLMGGAGINGAIHQAGGPTIMSELEQLRKRVGRCPTGDAVVTAVGDLPAKWVIHAVGPEYKGGQYGEAQELRSCYRRCIELSDEISVRTLTLPAISTGVYGYPMNQAARIAVNTIVDLLRTDETKVQRVTFVLNDNRAFREFAIAILDILAS